MSSSSAFETILLEILSDHGHNQFIHKLTDAKGSILDLIWSNHEDLSFKTLAIAFSDHYPLIFTTSTKLNPPQLTIQFKFLQVKLHSSKF